MSYNNFNLKIYLNSVKDYKLLTHEEEIHLANKIQRGSKDAKQKMINANLRLVIKIVKNYMNKGIKLEDLIQEGNLGLIKASEKYDPKKDTRFSTYASLWIKQALQRTLNSKARNIKLPYRKSILVAKINSYIASCEKEPSKENILKHFYISEKEYIKIIPYLERESSLDKKINETQTSILDLCPDNSFNPELILEKKEMLSSLRRCIDNLNPIEREIIIRRFNIDGLNKDRSMTLKELAKNLGISSEAVRQKEKRILKKLREFF